MDPVNHGVVGATAALTICQHYVKKASLATRIGFLLCGGLAAEAPDADRIIDHCLKPYGDDGQGLAYMLYHRGPTHTVLGCIVITALVAGLATAALRKASLFWLLCGAAFAGVGLHLGMDAMNDYGVHPFYPISERWFYGDFLFLAEPTVAVTLLPCLLVLIVGGPRRWVVPVSLAIVMAAVAILLHCGEWLQPFGAAVTVLWSVPQALAQQKQLRTRFAWLSLAGVLCVFLIGSQLARIRAVAWAKADGTASVADVSTTPAPANPLCWRVITLTHDRDSLEEHMGIIDFTPGSTTSDCFKPPHGALPASVCLPKPGAVASAAARKTPRTGRGPAIYEIAAFYGKVSEFEQLAQDKYVDATRHFLRLPFWGPSALGERCDASGRGSQQLIGDLRVDYQRDLAHYCKYPFVVGKPKTSIKLYKPVGDPPLFSDRSSLLH